VLQTPLAHTGLGAHRVDRIPGTGPLQGAAAILALLKKRGVDPASEIVPYCHRGARSAGAYYALRLAGLAGEKLNRSWHEWSSLPDLPIEQG
jgi:thiosulfate/3-mercaptopyruvate sulfurtransferase